MKTIFHYLLRVWISLNISFALTYLTIAALYDFSTVKFIFELPVLALMLLFIEFIVLWTLLYIYSDFSRSDDLK
jgi:hypothetical protein